MTGAWAWIHDLFETIGGVGAAIAAIVAVLLANRETRSRKAAESERDEVRRQARIAEEAAHARRVAVWFEVRRVTPDLMADSITIANYGELPVFGGRLGVLHSGLYRPTRFRFAALAPGERRSLYFASTGDPQERDRQNVRAAGATTPVMLWSRCAADGPAPNDIDELGRIFAFMYRDVRGKWWAQLGTGELKELDAGFPLDRAIDKATVLWQEPKDVGAFLS